MKKGMEGEMEKLLEHSQDLVRMLEPNSRYWGKITVAGSMIISFAESQPKLKPFADEVLKKINILEYEYLKTYPALYLHSELCKYVKHNEKHNRSNNPKKEK